MLSKKLKRPTTEQRKAFHYFGFDGIVPFNHVISRINELKEEFSEDELIERIHEHADHIESYFDSEELKNDGSISQKFNKDKRRQKWDSYKKDFKDFEFSGKVFPCNLSYLKVGLHQLFHQPSFQ